jgi:MoxR-like ATPase
MALPKTAAQISPSDDVAHLRRLASAVNSLREQVGRRIVGQQEVVDGIVTAILAGGHALLIGVPGLAKTLMVQTVAEALELTFNRVQFTPDLMPGDITGTEIVEEDPATGRRAFRFVPGPIFAHVVLADEINRTSPKVQSAMLEAMAEKQTTVDNRTRKLDELFFVIATQNPLDLAGTFPLPSAQLDRFLFKVRMKHIDRASELEILASYKARKAGAGQDLPRCTRTELIHARAVIENAVWVAPEIRECLVDFANKTRADPRVLQGTSTRSLVLMIPALQARALTRVRDYVSAEDVAYLAQYIFAHRLELAPGTDNVEAVIRDCINEPMERLARATLKRAG